VDISQNMQELASVKNGSDTALIQADFNSFEFPQKYDAVVSSLALHHLEADRDRKTLYGKIHRALNPGGSLQTWTL
jgi:tRNA (cmo5U34)-methyltransferase